jgi:hypothetical protein
LPSGNGQAILAEGFMKSTARYATFVVLAHAGAVFWHLVLVAKITPGLTAGQVLAATAAINLVPTIALVLLWAHFLRLGGFLLFLPLAVGLVIGGNEHFVTPGPLNVFYVAATPWALQFRDCSSPSRSGSVGMLDCHPGVHRCAVFKSGARAGLGPSMCKKLGLPTGWGEALAVEQFRAASMDRSTARQRKSANASRARFTSTLI